MTEPTELEVYRRDLAYDVFRHHPMFTLHSRVKTRHDWIGLYLLPKRHVIDMSALSLQVGPESQRLYLLSIYLPGEARGLGFGEELYDAACNVARMLELSHVVQYPSGQTVRGDTRFDYLVRRGWEPTECEQVCKRV